MHWNSPWIFSIQLSWIHPAKIKKCIVNNFYLSHLSIGLKVVLLLSEDFKLYIQTKVVLPTRFPECILKVNSYFFKKVCWHAMHSLVLWLVNSQEFTGKSDPNIQCVFCKKAYQSPNVFHCPWMFTAQEFSPSCKTN